MSAPGFVNVPLASVASLGMSDIVIGLLQRTCMFELADTSVGFLCGTPIAETLVEPPRWSSSPQLLGRQVYNYGPSP